MLHSYQLFFVKKEGQLMMQESNMVQWTNHNQHSRFVNLLSLPWLSKISGAIYLALTVLMASRQADELQMNFKITVD